MEDRNSAGARRNPARLAALLALLAALIAVVVIVQASDPSSSGSSPSVTRTSSHRPARHHAPRPSSYLVQPGDTLTIIAAKTHVSLETIQRLNPNVDPQALQTGQRLKLSP
ncbi:MAG TPA: LysM domain-containing protein [Conexibacter sp.]|nr:LysM domain-containing protein [Conexibacter sp.]